MPPDVIAQGVRPVLHHQADRPGHRARPVDDLRLRASSRAGRCASISEVGEGTTVRLYLPRAPRRGRGVADAATERGDAPRGQRRDGAGGRGRRDRAHAGDRGAGGARLPRPSRRRTAPSALPLLQSDRAHRPAGHRRRPAGGMNGRQLAEIARQNRPELKVLFITGYAENASVRASVLRPGWPSSPSRFRSRRWHKRSGNDFAGRSGNQWWRHQRRRRATGQGNLTRRVGHPAGCPTPTAHGGQLGIKVVAVYPTRK